jgi:hypothetical protein
MRLLGVVISFAPVGVFCLLFSLTARLGYDVLRQLGWYVAVVVVALGVQQFVVYSLSVRWLGGMRPAVFFRGVRPAMVTAFSTASSNATLPTALQVAEENLRLPPQVSRFVLSIGSTANQNGTALFEGVTVLFLAQFYGVELSLSQQVLVVFICILGGIGTAGVPAGSIPVVAMRDDPRDDRRSTRRDRHHPRRRPRARHVPHHRQRHRRPRCRGRRRTRRTQGFRGLEALQRIPRIPRIGLPSEVTSHRVIALRESVESA